MIGQAIKAGEGYVEIGIRKRLEQGANEILADLNQLGKKTMALGAVISGASAGLLAGPLKATAEMEETVSKFNVVFADSADELRKWSDATAAAMGISEKSMVFMLSSMQDLLVPMGVVPDRAAEMSKTLSQLAVDLGSFNNLHSDRVFADLMSAITGEGQVMKKYGVILTETATKQELLNMGMDPKIADDNAKAQARMNIILRGTTAAQGDAIRTAGSFTNQLKALWSAVTNASTAIGSEFIEDITAFVHVAVDGTKWLRTFIAANHDTVRALGLVATSAVGVGAALIGIGAAARLAASAMGGVMVAAKVAATAAAIAWSGVSLAFTVITIKSRITAAIITTAWTAAVAAIGIAWKGLTGLISIAMQGALAAVSAAAMVAPWLAAAAIITTAWLGVDTVMGALAIGASAAWAASAGVVTTAWTAAAGILTPVALAIGAAWTATAGFIATAWAGLSATFAATGLAGVASAAIASAAWSAYGAVAAIVAAEQSIAAAVVGAAWATAGFVASVAWTGFIAVLSAALTPAALLTAASFIVSGAWTVAATLVSTAWSVAWGIILSPIMPFIVAGAAALAVITALTAAAGFLAIKGADFAGAWGIATKTLGKLTETVNTTFDAIKVALGAGDYATAAQSLWLGVQAAFWDGVQASMEAFGWLFSEAWGVTKRFFTSLLDLAWQAMKAVANAILHPLDAAKSLSEGLASVMQSAMSFDPSAAATNARLRLTQIRAESDARRKQIELEKELAGLRKRESEIVADVKAGKMTVEEGRAQIQSARTEFKDRQKAKQIDEQVKAGVITQAKADEMKAALPSTATLPKEEQDTSVYNDKVNALEMEILALEKGETAAERKRLADEGLTATEIKQIEALKAKKQQLEELEKLEQKSQQRRVDKVFDKADDLRDAGASPNEIFQRVMYQIDQEEKSGRIDKETAGGARETARSQLDDDLDRLREEGRALAEALRTPGEKLNAELKRISQLQGLGAIDETTALRAEDQARKDFAIEEERNQKKVADQTDTLDQEQKRVGPNASFSAAGAAIIGAGPRLENEQLKATKEVAKNTATIAKEAKKSSVARFG